MFAWALKSGLLQDRLQAHATGENQADPASMFLTVLA